MKIDDDNNSKNDFVFCLINRSNASILVVFWTQKFKDKKKV